MLHLYKEKYKIPLRLTKGYLKMWRGMPYVYSWLERLNVVKMPNSSQLIYRLNAIFIKTPKGGFWNSTKMSLPFIWKINRHEECRTIWKREILSLRTYYKNWGEKRCVFSIRRPGNRTAHSLERSVYVCKKNPLSIEYDNEGTVYK